MAKIGARIHRLQEEMLSVNLHRSLHILMTMFFLVRTGTIRILM